MRTFGGSVPLRVRVRSVSVRLRRPQAGPAGAAAHARQRRHDVGGHLQPAVPGRVNVENPNDRELPIKGIDYKLFLEGDSFAEGVSNKPFTVPAQGDTDFDMTVRTNFVSGAAGCCRG